MKEQKITAISRSHYLKTFLTLTIFTFALVALSQSVSAKTITVTGTGDTIAVDGKVTLREAITAANSNLPVGDAPAGDPGFDTIKFNIPGGGVHTITLSSALPTISDTVIIDGTSQPGYTGTPVIELNGNNLAAPGLNILAGSSTVEGLVINRFDGNGIVLGTKGGNTIISNYIGTNSAGTSALGNTQDGINIQNSSGNNTIGGNAAGNVISGNGGNGITISNTTGPGNFVQGNYLGTNAAGTATLGNGSIGVRVFTANNTIGGALAGTANVIGGNFRGVSLEGTSATNNQVLGNYIGTNSAGAALGNNQEGVYISGPNNTVGGSLVASMRNVISGNGSGIFISSNGGTGNQILGNYIGTNPNGDAALGNTGLGIYISGSNNIIGGTSNGARNVISGNGNTGVFIDANGSGSIVQGNYIGLNAAGTAKVGNAGGVGIGGSDNTIGGTVAGAGNVISGNNTNGVGIVGNTASNNKVQGNLIGTNALGTVSIGNVSEGIRIIDAPNNLIGGSGSALARNIISSNFRGVTFEGNSATGNVVQGNYIGTDITGTIAFGNNQEGVLIGAPGNVIGGAAAGDGNLISGNLQGIYITGPTTTGNVVQGNLIGTQADGKSPLRNIYSGVQIFSAFNNTIGGATPGAGNTIASNFYGVYISSGTGNAVLGNSIFDNGVLGIDLDPYTLTPNDTADPDSGPNKQQNYPLLTSVTTSGGNTTFQGKLNSNPNTSFRIEFFSNTACDPSGFGQGTTFLGSTNVGTDANGDAQINVTLPVAPVGQYVTATATSGANNTSEFSPCALVGGPNPGSFQFAFNSFVAFEIDGTMATITVTRSSGMMGAVSVDYATSDGSAQAPGDYTATSGTLNFADGELIKTFTVPVAADAIAEGQEDVNLTLSNPTGGATLGAQKTSKLFILDYSKSLSTVFFSDASVVEGNSGTTNMVFHITVTPHDNVVTVGYSTQDGTAKAGVDYQAVSGTLTFNPGESDKTVVVPVIGDTLTEGDEIFFLNLTQLVNATVSDGQGEGLIIDDEGLPILSLSAPTFDVNENGGSLDIHVTRAGASGTATVDYTTVDGSAVAGSDYTTKTGTLTFAANETDKVISIPILNDTQNEPDETFKLKLSNPANAVFGGPSEAVVTIHDDDLVSVSVNNVSHAEGDSGTTSFDFNVTLSGASNQTVKVDYATAPGTATSGSDYQPVSGTLTFLPGEVSKSVSVQVNGDTTPEPDETFAVQLSNPSNATLANAQGLGTIVNDDAPQGAGSFDFSAASYTIKESGITATINVRRTGGSAGAVSVQYATGAGGTATAGSDYTSTSGTLNWADGDTADKTFSVAILDDTLDEPGETVQLGLSNPTGGATLGSQSAATLTITDDDPQPSLSISDASLAEGDSGTKNMSFTVTLSAASGQAVTVHYATGGGTATPGSDYQASSDDLTFQPGEVSKKVTVTVNGDTQVEPDETFLVSLSQAANASIAKSDGTGTILNDDSASQTASLQFEQGSYNVNEGDHFKLINVTRTGDTSADVFVDYATTDGTANQRTDYNLMLGTLHFAPGETSKTLTFLVTEDSYVEGDETLSLALSNPVGATLGSQSQAQITIVDNDSDPNAPNAILDAQNFIRQQYHDFLNREPDPPGFQGWQDTLKNCAPGDTKCDRIEVSSAFYRSQEFHDRGYFIYRFYSAALGRTPHYEEFMKDMQKVSGFLSAQEQEQAKVDFISEFMARSEFQQKYGLVTDAGAYIDALSQAAGVTLSNRDQIVQQLQGGQMTRGQALRSVVESVEVDQKFYDEAFVVMQYFGYLRREPDILYLQWIQTLKQVKDYRVLVNGFLNSLEYDLRFGH